MLSQTKQSKVVKRLHSVANSAGLITWDALTKISSAENIKAVELIEIAEGELNYKVIKQPKVVLPPGEKMPVPPALSKQRSLKQSRAPSDLVKRQIMTGGIYRQLGCDIDLNLEPEDWIIVTYGEWLKERQMIAAWIESLGGELPK